MEVISSENYPGSPRLEEPVHSLYADEQPKRRLRNKVTHSKLADTVSIVNAIMLNVEDLAKATGRVATNNSGDEMNREHNDKNSGQQIRTFVQGSSRRRGSGTRRRGYENRTSPASDLGDASVEARTSVIRGLPQNRKRRPTSSESETEETANAGEKDDVEKTEYGHLRCYEQIFEKETGCAADGLSGRGKEDRLETIRNCPSHVDVSMTQDRISENIGRGPGSGARTVVPYPISVVDARLHAQAANVYLPAHVHDMSTQYRIQHPPEFPISQTEQMGKQFFDRGNLPPTQTSGPGNSGNVQHSFPLNPHGKFGFPDGLVMQQHTDLANTYGYTMFETRSPASSTSSGKDRELQAEQEPLKNSVQHFSSPVGSTRDERSHTPPIPNSLSQNQKTSDETADDKKLDGNKNIKEKRGKSENANQCGQCCKTFASSSALAKHKLTHSDERRYICNICAKGFKRQDHLNGHMLTHRDKKPYECKVVHCDKSYCDMRSLRRHIEHYHPNDATPSMTSSAALSKPDNEQMTYQFSSGQHKNQMLIQDVDESSPKSVQEVAHHGKSKQEASQVVGRKRNSDSICSNNSEDATRRPDSHSPHQSQIYDKPTSANMLKQVGEQTQDSKTEKQVLDGYPHSGYYKYQDGGNSQWYHPYPSPMIHMYQINNSMMVSQTVAPYHGQRHNNAYCAGDLPQMVPTYPYVNQNQASRGNERNVDDRTNLGKVEEDGYHGMMYRESGAPPDPTSIAIVNAKDHTKEARYKEGNASISPVVQWKSVVSKDSSGMSPYSMGNNPVSMQYNPVNLSMVLPDAKVSHEQPTPLNISIPSSQTEKRCQEMADIDQPPLAKRIVHSQAALITGEDRLLKLGDGSMKPPSYTESHEVFRNRPSTPPRKPRPKPDPIHIPCSTFAGPPMSPPIYTPPPMLSPRSIFHISSSLTPRCIGSTPLTPSRFFLGNRSRKNSLEGDLDHPEIILPEPKINIGAQFQAEIPYGIAPRKHAEFDKHRVAVCWIPFENETKKRSQEIEAFLNMACSVAVHGGGSNKEYALHVLYRLKGNIKQAVRHILANKSVIQKEDCLADYHYEGSGKWSSKERLKFREALGAKGKDFFQISKEIETKTVAQCVEFYYLWKATHPEAMRSRTRYAETESESETVDYFSDDGNSTLVFECDFPECHSKFISRQALNGHIRVHGGSFMKPSEPKRTKVKTTTNSNSSNSNASGATTTVNRSVTKSAKPPPPAANATNGDEPLPEFACKVCGRIFHKIKSRSAHMKTHVKRNDDDHRGGSKM